jgi:hypothetical protein
MRNCLAAMKLKVLLFEFICGYVVSGCLIAAIAVYGVGRDVALTIAASLFLVPIAGVLGFFLADIIFLDRRSYLLVLQVLLAAFFGVVSSLVVFYFLQFGLLAILVGWISSVGVAYLVWQGATR